MLRHLQQQNSTIRNLQLGNYMSIQHYADMIIIYGENCQPTQLIKNYNG